MPAARLNFAERNLRTRCLGELGDFAGAVGFQQQEGVVEFPDTHKGDAGGEGTEPLDLRDDDRKRGEHRREGALGQRDDAEFSQHRGSQRSKHGRWISSHRVTVPAKDHSEL